MTARQSIADRADRVRFIRSYIFPDVDSRENNPRFRGFVFK
jgi:hypothetical protein